jgi:hypothetical protein
MYYSLLGSELAICLDWAESSSLVMVIGWVGLELACLLYLKIVLYKLA